MRTIKINYTTSDGGEFETKEEAERHEALLTASKDYEDARSKFAKAFVSTQRTADGHLFDFNSYRPYFYITGRYDPGLPSLKEIRHLGYNLKLDECDRLVLYTGAHGTSSYAFGIQISELYRDVHKAQLALINAQEHKLKMYSDEIEKLKQKINREGDDRQ